MHTLLSAITPGNLLVIFSTTSTVWIFFYVTSCYYYPFIEACINRYKAILRYYFKIEADRDNLDVIQVYMGLIEFQRPGKTYFITRLCPAFERRQYFTADNPVDLCRYIIKIHGVAELIDVDKAGTHP